MERVSVFKTTDYDENTLNSAVSKHFDALGIKESEIKGKNVVIKPNLLMKRTPEEGTTTHPALVGAIIKKIKNFGPKSITITDSPGGPYTKVALSGIYKAAGYEQLAKELDVNLNYDVGYSEVANPNGQYVKSFHIINSIVNADYIISVAKLKTHCMTGLSGGVKNLFGCVPGLMKPEFHYRFPDINHFCGMLVDLCECVKPNITFVDAVISMEGDGPSGGELKRTNLTFASRNPYNLDLTLCETIGIKPSNVYTLTQAAQRGLCLEKLDHSILFGDIECLKQAGSFKMPSSKTIDFSANIPKIIRKPVMALAHTFATPKPHIILKGCIGCGKCAESCPAKTIKIVNRKAKIDYSNCIKCYCCHEMCPVKTIDIKRFKLFDF